MQTHAAVLFLAMLAAPLAAQAQAAPAAPATSGAPAPGEPDVRRTVLEDQGSRIEELRVRGTTQRIVVTPKVGNLQPYEILTPDGGRDLTFSAGNPKGAAGQRVWNVLRF